MPVRVASLPTGLRRLSPRAALRGAWHRPGLPLSLAVGLLVAASCTPGTATLSTVPSGTELAPAGQSQPGPETAAPADAAPEAAARQAPATTQSSGGPDEPAAAGGGSGQPTGPEQPPPQPAQPVGEVDDEDVHRPGVRVDGLDQVAGGLVQAAVKHEKVTFATALARSRDVVVDESGTPHDVALAAVDPRGMRRLVPEVTAKETALWQRLAEGDAVVDYHAAERLGVQLGDRLTVSGAGGKSLRVGALADTGQPPVADVLVSTPTGRWLSMPDPNALLAAVADGTPASRAAITLQKELGGRAVALVDPDRLRGSQPRTRVVDVPEHVWYRLARCESSGRWSLDSGNGYYGGLQFLPETWWWVGGQGLPHEATPQEQIRRAEVLLSVQGWDAWPVCSKKLGLRQTVGTVEGVR